MNLDSLTAVLSHIGNLVINLTKKNLNSSVQELKELIHTFGGEAEQHFYKVVLSQLEWTSESSDLKPLTNSAGNLYNNNSGANSGGEGKDKDNTGGGINSPVLTFNSSSGAALTLLVQELASFIPLHRFSTFLACAVFSLISSGTTIQQGCVRGICKALKLTNVQEVVLCLQLLQFSCPEIKSQSTALLKSKLPELLKHYTQADGVGRELSEFSVEALHLILTQALPFPDSKDTTSALLSSDLEADLLLALQKEFPRSQTPLVLLPILYPKSDPLMEKLNLESFTDMAKYTLYGSLADFVAELGYNFCSSVDECRANLASFGEQAISPAAVAKVLGLMVKTHSGLQSEQLGLQNLSDPSSLWMESKEKGVMGTPGRGQNVDTGAATPNVAGTWNVEVFIKALLEVVPNINGKAVIGKLDFKGFVVNDKNGLKLLILALRCLLQGQGLRPDLFPVDCFYRPWKNSEEQLQLLEQILSNPDVFCFADYPCRLVATEGLKTLPEMDNKAVATWKSLDLVEILLRLADAGHYAFVKEMLKFPIQHCPDILVLGLIQVPQVYTSLRQELIRSLVPIFLGNHPNGTNVLHHIWNAQKETVMVRQILMVALAEWYMLVENDQTRLAKIFDVAQDLKALSMLLNAQPFSFVIDLACLAYRREYLNLEKWLTGKIREHGEIFITSCVKFLQRRCPQLVGGKEGLMPKSTQLPHETVSTMLACLQSCAINLPQDLADSVLTMVQNCSILARTRQINFPVADPLTGMGASLSSLNLGSSVSSSIFPSQVSSSIGLGNLASLSSVPPGSPACPTLPPSNPTPPSSQSSLSSILPSLQQLGGPPPNPSVGSQLPTIPSQTVMGSTALPAAVIRSQSVQPSVPQTRQNELLGDFSQIYEIPQLISKEVEDEANTFFQRIYNQPPNPTISIEEVLEMLKNYHESANKRERDVYSCMLKNLFEEYHFFPTYPNRELILTARLFGGIIERRLVEYVTLGNALRHVLEALQKPHGNKMYYFGVVALDRFKGRLREYPKYCQHLMTMEHFNQFPPHLIEYIKYGTQSQEPPNRPSGPVLPPSMNISPNAPVVVPSSAMQAPNPALATAAVKAPTPATTVPASAAVSRPQSLAAAAGKPTIATTNIETLLLAADKEGILATPPPDLMQDKIAFIFNNLSQLNLAQKCEELKEIVTEEYWPWVSQYLVIHRVSMENNFHTLYSLFLDQLNIRTVTEIVLQETLRNVKGFLPQVLLRAHKSEAKPSDKSLLKNLGHWLGMLTLAKNRPILFIDIDVKSLLIEAYKKELQELQYVVPFVAKVLESCAKSRVFKPPNPWTMAIMNVLAELHGEPDMKLHLKFEIEVLCNKLELNVKELKPGNILKNSVKLSRLKPQLSHVTAAGKRAESTPLFPTLQAMPKAQDLNLPGITPTATPPTVVPTQTAATPPHIQALPQAPEPRFVYSEISQSSLTCFDAHVTVSVPQIGNLEKSSQLKQLVRHAVESSVQEIITPIIERSIKIAVPTAELIIKKDFALEPDEMRMRAATHHIVRNLTAAMAMTTSKDHLPAAIAKGIKQNILSWFNRQKTSQQNIDQVDQLATAIAQENIGIACAFIQKTAAEKAVLEMDKRFMAEYEARKLARAEGRRYCDARALKYQVENMPDQIRVKVGRVTPQQTAVYEEYARNIPGFVPIVDDDSMLVTKPVPLTNASFTTEELAAFLLMMERIIQELEHIIQTFSTLAPTSPLVQMLHSLLEGLLFYRSNRENAAAQLLIKKVVDNLFEGIRELPAEPELNQLRVQFRDVHLILLKAITDQRAYGAEWTAKFVTKFWSETREEIRYNLDVMDWLLRSSLINVQMLDEHLHRAIEEPRLTATVTPLLFIIRLIQAYLIDDPSSAIINDTDLPLTLESLIRLCQSRQAPESLVTLIESLRLRYDPIMGSERLSTPSNSLVGSLRVASGVQLPSNNIFHSSNLSQSRDLALSDALGQQEKTEQLLRMWIQLYSSNNAGQGSTIAFQHFIQQMDMHGFFKTNEVVSRFLRICITTCRDICVRSILEGGSGSSPAFVRSKCFPTLDAFVRLLALLVKKSGESSNPSAKINLLNKILGLICDVMLHDIETHGNEFQQLPYHRILIMLFLELTAPETVLESINLPVLMYFTHALHCLRPSRCPGFAYAWLEIVSHREFIGRMLGITPQQKGWDLYATLLQDIFKFLAPFLRNVELSKPFDVLYKGTLRVLLVLFHDFREFLCEYYYTFCEVIPPNCIQMRNLILSVCPRNITLPDPFVSDLKVELLAEISLSPKINTNVALLIKPPELKKNLDAYLENRSNVAFLSELRSYLQVSNEPGMRYNVSVLNALVLYVGMQAIAQIQSKGLTPSMTTITHSAHMDIFENLAVDLDTEGRYLFLTSVANHLRYPNSHTYYFSCMLLYLFSEANNEAIQEQITRVLVERLLPKIKQPWGLKITLNALLKNPSFKFWSHDFVRCAPEFENLFEPLAPKGMLEDRDLVEGRSSKVHILTTA